MSQNPFDALGGSGGLDLGARLTRETKGAVIQNYGFADESFSTPIAVLADFTGSHTSKNASPKASLDWSVNDDVRLYASYSAGLPSRRQSRDSDPLRSAKAIWRRCWMAPLQSRRRCSTFLFRKYCSFPIRLISSSCVPALGGRTPR